MFQIKVRKNTLRLAKTHVRVRNGLPFYIQYIVFNISGAGVVYGHVPSCCDNKAKVYDPPPMLSRNITSLPC